MVIIGEGRYIINFDIKYYKCHLKLLITKVTSSKLNLL